MAQSATRLSHILKVGVRSSLVSVCHGNTYWRRETTANQRCTENCQTTVTPECRINVQGSTDGP